MISKKEFVIEKEELLPGMDRHVHEKNSVFRPKTELGKRLWSIRKRIVASGDPLLNWDQIEEEIAARRGEID